MKTLFSLLLICISVAALAQVETTQSINSTTRHISEELRCPVCRGIPIADSPSELAQSMIKVIEEKQKEGLTEDQILNYFVERYGDWILLKPKAQGLNLFTLWILPGTLFVAGVIVLVFSARKWLQRKKN